MRGTDCSRLGFRDDVSVESSDDCQSLGRCRAKPPVFRPESLSKLGETLWRGHLGKGKMVSSTSR